MQLSLLLLWALLVLGFSLLFEVERPGYAFHPRFRTCNIFDRGSVCSRKKWGRLLKRLGTTALEHRVKNINSLLEQVLKKNIFFPTSKTKY